MITSALKVDNYDWLKTFAIAMVLIDHTGYFFIDNADWWSVFGRLAAPPFFFLMGYASTRTFPLKWLWLAIILTLLESWNTDWTWVVPNILFSLILIRLARPYILRLLQSYGRIALALLIVSLLAVLPVAETMMDYGAEGWLWALFGLCQGMYTENSTGNQNGPERNWKTMRLLSGWAAAVVYVWQEQLEFQFSGNELATVILGVATLTLFLCLFRRGPSRLQPPVYFAAPLRFVGRHTLEIYFIQLAGCEILVGLFPGSAA